MENDQIKISHSTTIGHFKANNRDYILSACWRFLSSTAADAGISALRRALRSSPGRWRRRRRTARRLTRMSHHVAGGTEANGLSGQEGREARCGDIGQALRRILSAHSPRPKGRGGAGRPRRRAAWAVYPDTLFAALLAARRRPAR